MTTGNFSQKNGVFKIPDKEGSVLTVNLPDGSPRYILLQKVDDLVELLQENYQGSKEPINPIEELDGLISILKQIDDEIEKEPQKHWTEDLPESTREAVSEFLPDELIPGRTPFNPLPQQAEELTTETTEGVTEEETPLQQIEDIPKVPSEAEKVATTVPVQAAAEREPQQEHQLPLWENTVTSEESGKEDVVEGPLVRSFDNMTRGKPVTLQVYHGTSPSVSTTIGDTGFRVGANVQQHGFTPEAAQRLGREPVSYTHLTLPTIYSV